jgi:SAM-dependent methyltransferase
LKESLIERLRCPYTGQPLQLTEAHPSAGRIEAGQLATPDGARRYPIVNFVPRFVPATNYADSFGFQWNRFRRTQLDSYSGQPISHDRYYRFTGWTPEQLAGRRVLDVGCGAGRFTEIALAAGAHVVAVDYSSAVDACWANHAHNPNLDVVQGDIYRLPFVPGQFDYVYCLGVLQHTPEVRAAFDALPSQLAPGGRIAVDLYPKLRVNRFLPRYLLRRFTTRTPPRTLFQAVERVVPLLLPVSRAIGRIPLVGRGLRHVIPVANYEGVFALSPAQQREWAVLDTFDWLAPRYDQPQTPQDLLAWLQEAGLEDIWVGRLGFLVGRGRRPREDGMPHA